MMFLLNDANKTTLDILYIVSPGILRGRQNLPAQAMMLCLLDAPHSISHQLNFCYITHILTNHMRAYANTHLHTHTEGAVSSMDILHDIHVLTR